MRTVVFDNHEITYPEELCFVFNPQMIIVTSEDNVTTEIAGNQKVYKDVRSPINGKMSLDMSEYMRMMFDVDWNKFIDIINVTISIKIGISNFQFSTKCIWGVLNIGEVFNPSRVVTMFKNFPFTLGLYVTSTSILSFRYDKEGYSTIDSISSSEINHNIDDIFKEVTEFGVFRIESTPSDPTSFSYTFDKTFRPVGDGIILVRVLVDDSECGVYLRWIDRHGFYRFYLFKDGDKVSQSANNGELIYQDYSDVKYTYNGVARYQGKKMNNTIKACATLVNKETFNMLSTLYSSPIVDLYIDGNWIPVNIMASSFIDTGKTLQDFEIQITIPEIISQLL